MSHPDPGYPFDQYDRDGLPINPAADQTYRTPVYAQQPQYAAGYVEQKSWLVAVLLAFFLGTLGVHNFYLGHTGRGVAQLVLTFTGWVTAILLVGFFLLAIVGLWVLVDFVLILLRSGSLGRDSRGVPLK